ncbi:MAG: hypothetical protein AAB413_00980 [Patescibacteria group bacterium]
MTDRIAVLIEKWGEVISKLYTLARLNRELAGVTSYPHLNAGIRALMPIMNALIAALDASELEMRKELEANRVAVEALDARADNPAPRMPDGEHRRFPVLEILERLRNSPVVDLDKLEIDPEVVRLVPKEVAVKHQLIAFSLAGTGNDRVLWVAMVDLTNIFAFDDVKFLTGYLVEARAADEAMITRAIAKYYTDAPPPDAA